MTRGNIFFQISPCQPVKKQPQISVFTTFRLSTDDRGHPADSLWTAGGQPMPQRGAKARVNNTLGQ